LVAKVGNPLPDRPFGVRQVEYRQQAIHKGDDVLLRIDVRRGGQSAGGGLEDGGLMWRQESASRFGRTGRRCAR
jgi:hypothetical protein